MRLPLMDGACRRACLRAAGPWLLLAALLAGAHVLVWAAIQPPSPRTGEVPPDVFSEPRARAVVDHLSERIGVRLNGTPAHRQAAGYLAAELRKIPGFQVEIQEVTGTHIFSTVPFPPFVYRTVNVVGRLPGRSNHAVLLDAHFDTQLDSVGAADDAAGVAAIVETARILAREPRAAQSLVVNLNGAEEIGLLGAAGFLQHRWAKDVRAYVYVEALPGGTTSLLAAGPGNAWLAKTYARAVPRPFGSVVGQDLMRTGLLPHNGDFTPFHEAGLAGLDMAMTSDGWAYHTMLDRTGRLRPGSVQHLGDSLLGVTRALVNGPLPVDDRPAGAVYYDFLGLVMAAYATPTARRLEVAALVLALAAIGWAIRRGQVALPAVAAALGWTAVVVVAGLLTAVAAAAIVALGLGRPLGWFSAPGLLIPAFGAPALAGSIAIHALWRGRALRHRDPPAHGRAAIAGALLFWSLLLALCSAKGIGAGYLPFHWVLGAVTALALSIGPFADRVASPVAGPLARPLAALALMFACLTPALLLTLQLGMSFLTYLVPITGMLGVGGADLLVAALVGVTAVSMLLLPLATMQRSGGWKGAALVAAGTGLLGLALVATRFPYTELRPKRISVSHMAYGEASAVRVKPSDGVAMPAILAALPGRPLPAEGRLPGADGLTYEFSAPPPPMPAPRADVEGQEVLADGNRRVTVRIHGTSPLIRLVVPRQALLGWSLAPALTDTRPIGGRYVAQFYDLDPAGKTITLTLRGKLPVEIELRGTDGVRASGPEVQAILKALPRWVTPSAQANRTTRLKI